MKRRIRMGLVIVLAMAFISGTIVCGKGKTFDPDDFCMGIHIIDLLDKDVYQQDGKKMVEIFSDRIENPNSTDNVCMVEMKKELFGDVYYKKTVNVGDADYIYYGKLKDEKPNGWGILFDMESNPFYIGNFKKGKIQGYGMVLAEAEYAYSIVYEGKISKVKANGDVVPANGNAVIPYSYRQLVDAYWYRDGAGWYDEEIELGQGLWAFECSPKYIGKIKNGQYSGKGTLYDVYGNVVYEGEFKKGQYSGKGTLYYEDGSVQYTGQFKNGKYDGKGTLYNVDGSIRHKGKFKNGDVK